MRSTQHVAAASLQSDHQPLLIVQRSVPGCCCADGCRCRLLTQASGAEASPPEAGGTRSRPLHVVMQVGLMP